MLTQEGLNDFVTNMDNLSEGEPALKARGRLNRLFSWKVRKEEEEEPPSLQMLLKFLIERGMKALVFGWKNTAASFGYGSTEDVTEDVTEDFRKTAKLMKSKELLLYIASFNGHRSSEDFETYKRRIEKVLMKKGIKANGIFDANPT